MGVRGGDRSHQRGCLSCDIPLIWRIEGILLGGANQRHQVGAGGGPASLGHRQVSAVGWGKGKEKGKEKGKGKEEDNNEMEKEKG